MIIKNINAEDLIINAETIQYEMSRRGVSKPVNEYLVAASNLMIVEMIKEFVTEIKKQGNNDN
jgi:hypothetical protein